MSRARSPGFQATTPFLTSENIRNIFIRFAFDEPTKDDYDRFKEKFNDAGVDAKKSFDTYLGAFCKGFLKSPDYKSGDTTRVRYKMCCELVDYCSFQYQPWFYLVCTAVVCLLIYIVSVGLVTCCVLKGKKGGGGSKSPKEGKATGKMSKSKSTSKSKSKSKKK